MKKDLPTIPLFSENLYLVVFIFCFDLNMCLIQFFYIWMAPSLFCK